MRKLYSYRKFSIRHVQWGPMGMPILIPRHEQDDVYYLQCGNQPKMGASSLACDMSTRIYIYIIHF